jgi:hypothetical protein
MRSHRFRAIALTVALVLLAVAGPVASASGAQATQITTPAGLTYPFIQEGGKIAVAGTATGLTVADVEIRCYYGAEPAGYRTIAGKVPVADDAFSVEASTFELPNALCQLRAVPETSPLPTKPALPPGEDERFEGPLVVASEFVPETSNYYAASSTLTGTFFLGGYALESFLYSAAGHDNAQLFYGAANLSASVADETRSSVEVDGSDAYLPKAAREVEEDFKKEAERKKASFTPPTGKPAVAVEDHFDEASRQMTVEERDPVVKCSPEPATYPPTPSSCTSFVATGVEVQRTWQTSDEDHVAALTETWSSSDGAAHTVSVRYFDEMASAKGGGAYEFPGETSFVPTREGEVTTLPAGPRAILYRTAEKLTEIGDDEHPQGAIVYDTAPSEAIQITSGSRNGTYNSFEAPYLLPIPAGGSSAPVRMTFVQAFALTEVDALVAAAIAGYEPSAPSGPPATPATTPTAASAPVTVSLAGSAGSAKGHVSLKLACHGAAGTSCRIHVSLTTVEKSRSGHLIALAATRTRSKQVTLATDTVVIPAGHQLEVTLTLNATGRKLLARFGKLPARLTAVLEAASARHTVFARNLTIEPRRRRHSH